MKPKYVKRLRLPEDVWEQLVITARVGQVTEEEVMVAAWSHFASLPPDLRRQLAYEWWYRGAYGPEVRGRRRKHGKGLRHLVRRGLACFRRILDWAGRGRHGAE